MKACKKLQAFFVIQFLFNIYKHFIIRITKTNPLAQFFCFQYFMYCNNVNKL
jgi:hypothetical protein